MTPEEAIEIIEKQIVNCEAMIDFNENFDPEEDNTKFLKEKEALLMAVKSIKEVQRYREIGTVKECRELASIVNKVERNELAKIIDEWISYRKIGTVEECREAVEKQKPKKPKEILRHRGGFEMQHCPKCDTDYQVDRRYKIKDGYCPACGKLLDSAFRNYCANCGQAIDENLEGMEDD